MDFSKNTSANLAILSLFLASIVIVFLSRNPLPYSFLSPLHKISSNNYTLPVQKDELEIALEKASMPNKTVIIAIINKAYVEPHENEYPTMFDLFLEGFWAGEGTKELLGNLLVVAMDKTAHDRCIFRRLNCYEMPGSGEEFSGEKVYMSREFIEMMWRRTSFLLDVLTRGYNFIFTDTDVIWLRNPFTKLTKNVTVDIQISTDGFNGDSFSERNPINTGFYLVRSNNRTTALFQTWYDQRNTSTGMKEQDVLINLVQHGVLRKLGIQAVFLDTNYFSGFCADSKDVRAVATVHANCCKTIGAKVADLKAVLRDWKVIKGAAGKLDGNSTFQWSRHVACIRAFKGRR